MLIAPKKLKIVWTLYGEVTPKARPRVINGRAILPPNYDRWKQDATVFLQELAFLLPMSQREQLPLKIKTRVSAIFRGSLRGNADLDNGIGSILDALQDAKVLFEDNRKYVCAIAAEYREPEKPKQRETEIIIESID